MSLVGGITEGRSVLNKSLGCELCRIGYVPAEVTGYILTETWERADPEVPVWGSHHSPLPSPTLHSSTFYSGPFHFLWHLIKCFAKEYCSQCCRRSSGDLHVLISRLFQVFLKFSISNRLSFVFYCFRICLQRKTCDLCSQVEHLKARFWARKYPC